MAAGHASPGHPGIAEKVSIDLSRLEAGMLWVFGVPLGGSSSPRHSTRFPRYSGPVDPDKARWQEWQIVQSHLHLDDFLP